VSAVFADVSCVVSLMCVIPMGRRSDVTVVLVSGEWYLQFFVEVVLSGLCLVDLCFGDRLSVLCIVMGGEVGLGLVIVGGG
jgi:hypothetical protein